MKCWSPLMAQPSRQGYSILQQGQSNDPSYTYTAVLSATDSVVSKSACYPAALTAKVLSKKKLVAEAMLTEP